MGQAVLPGGGASEVVALDDPAKTPTRVASPVGTDGVRQSHLRKVVRLPAPADPTKVGRLEPGDPLLAADDEVQSGPANRGREQPVGICWS